MNENNNSNNQGYLSGFDSVKPVIDKNGNQFNPTPMFTAFNPQTGYAASPNEMQFENATENVVPPTVPPTVGPSAPITDEPAPVFSVYDPANEPVATPENEPVAAPENEPVAAPVSEPVAQPVDQPVAPPVSESKATTPPVPEKPQVPSFIPNGTYSYSASKNSLENNTPVSSSPFINMPSVNNTNPVESPFTAPQFSQNIYSVPSNSFGAPQNDTPFAPKTEMSFMVQNDTPFMPQSGMHDFDDDHMPGRHGKGIVILSALLAIVLGLGSGVFGAFLANKYIDNGEVSSSTTQDVQQNVTNITVDETVNSSIEAVAKKAGPSIIGIRTTAAVTNFFGGSSEATGEGSGIIYSTDGYIITNYHVIESAVKSTNSKVEVFLASDTKTAIPATIIGYNIASDLAVVKIEKTGLPAIEFSDSDKLNVGQYAIAIGNPGGLEFIGSISYGIISGLNRSVTLGTGNTMSLIQTDAAINPGNSGGALVDIEGKLIGVNSIKLVSTGYEGMGFAIPSNTVKEICDNIIAKQNDPTPYIGIEISQRYTSEQLIALGYPEGAVVVSVTEGGPAYESQIHRGDIITEFNGTPIKDYQQLENAIAQCKPGDSVTVKIFRAGRFYSSHINIAANNAQ